MNICILSNFTKTYLFHEIAQQLEKSNIHAFWIATNRPLYQFLVSQYGEGRVLLINLTYSDRPALTVNDFKLNELMYGDRYLRHKTEIGFRYLRHIQKPIYDFLAKNQIKAVFGEITWSHEVLIHRMCKQCPELDCTFLNPHVVRIPDNRFAFYTDERQSRLLQVERQEEWKGEILEARKPDYLKLNDKIVKKSSSLSGRLNRLKRFITNENMDPLDPTLLPNVRQRVQMAWNQEWNKETYKSVNRVSFDEVKHQPFVFLGLHKQPEASVDVFGRYYEDQLLNIQNLWRALPEGWNLLIKEHTNAIGDRSTAFYKAIKKLAGVYLVDEKTNSYEMIRQAALVATITGTIAYEAALMQVPSVTFAPTFFNQLNTCATIDLRDLNQHLLSNIASSLREKPDNREAFSKYIFINSFEGRMIDPISDPRSITSENVSLIAEGMKQALAFTQTQSSSQQVLGQHTA